MKLKMKFLCLRLPVVAALAGVLLAVAAQPAIGEQLSTNKPERIEFMVDVAEDMAKFVFTPTKPTDSEPVRGAFFVAEGNIYPAGTIPASNGTQFDPSLPGALGRWFCKGTFLVPGSQFDKSAMAVLTDQMFMLPNDQKAIFTAGTEGNGLATRTVIGGTGPYSGYVGEQVQQFLGFNKSGGVNLRVKISLRRVAN
jgi:hypothetical protein